MNRNLNLNPSLYSPTEYYDSLMGYNIAIHSSARVSLESDGFLQRMHQILGRENPTDVQEIEVIATGSDGRGEKGPRSPIDIIVLLSRRVERDIRENMRLVLSNELKTVSIRNKELDELLVHPDFEGVEVKNLMNGALYRFRGGDQEHHVWPNRLIDTTTLVRDSDILTRAKIQLYGEYQQHGKEILDIERKRRKKYRGSTRGKEGNLDTIGTNNKGGEVRRHFDLNTGTAFYNPLGEVAGFKHGPIRLVQTALSCNIAEAIIKGEMSERFLLDCPGNTVNKIYFLQASGVIKNSFNELAEYAGLYKYFLWLYHQSEFAFRAFGQKEMHFDPVQVRENLMGLARLEESIKFKG